MASPAEHTSHALRRLGLGPHPDLVDTMTSTDEAIARALDLTPPVTPPPTIEPPIDFEDARRRGQAEPMYRYWLTQMLTSPRLVEERLVWFWHDHFATSVEKVKVPYSMWTQHLTIRAHATGSFADLLHAMAVDPAMLRYLDGVQNQRGAFNENFGREVLELFTVGPGAFEESDVVAASASFSGWVVNVPGHRRSLHDVEPWQSVFVPWRHDDSSKTLFGVTGAHDAGDAVDIILDQEATARTVAAKLFTELVGVAPDERTARALGATFRKTYDVLPLVESIAAHPAFTANETIRNKVASPLERAVGVLRGFTLDHGGEPGAAIRYLDTVSYVPLRPPNVAGFPSGPRLLGPHHLVHGFDLLGAVRHPVPDFTAAAMLARLGVHDASEQTLAALDSAADPTIRLGLAVASPEYALT